MSNDRAKEFADKVAGGIVTALEQGTARWIKPWNPGELQAQFNPTTGNPYRGINQMWLETVAGMRGYTDPRWMTYKQAAKNNTPVIKGQKGTEIEYWQWTREEFVRDENGNKVRDEKGEYLKENVRLNTPYRFAAHVFNAAQMEGMPPLAREAMTEFARHEMAEKILANTDAPIRYMTGDAAYYHPRHDQITLPERGQFHSADAFYATAFHEIGHSTGHPSRLNRDLAHPFGSEGYAREELVAEISSYMIAQQTGMGYDPGNHHSYIASWVKILKEEPRAIFRASAQAEQVMKFVMAYGQEHEQRLEIQGPLIAAAERQSKLTAVKEKTEQTETQVQEAGVPMARVDLNVKYSERGAVKALGGKWDKEDKVWYVPEGVDPAPFSKWVDISVPPAQGLQNQDDETTRKIREMVAAAPAVTEGMERLWRVEPSVKGNLPEWLNEAVEANGSRAASGRWFTDTVESLAWYAKDQRDLGPVLFYVDVTAADRNQMSVANPAHPHAPHPKQFSRDVDTEFFVSPEIAAQKVMVGLVGEQQVSQQEVARAVQKQPAPSNTERAFIHVPFEQKAEAKALGAKWDGKAKQWYVPEGVELALFARWAEPQATKAVSVDDMNAHLLSPEEEFGQALRDEGFDLKSLPEMDGKFHRCRVDGDRAGEASGSYKAFNDLAKGGLPAGYIHNYRTGVETNWKYSQVTPRLTPEERKQQQAEHAVKLAARDAARLAAYLKAGEQVEQILLTASPAPQNHPYLQSKDVSGHGLLVMDNVVPFGDGEQPQQFGGKGHLLVPAHDIDGKVWTAQTISPTGKKLFAVGARKEGAHNLIGTVQNDHPIMFSEGWATGRDLHERTGWPIVVCFDAGNLKPVAEAYRDRYPDRLFIIAGDNDHQREKEVDARGVQKPNVGKEKAMATAAAVGGYALLPSFGGNGDGTDWNDLRVKYGLESQLLQLREGVEIAKRQHLQNELERSGMGVSIRQGLSDQAAERVLEHTKERAITAKARVRSIDDKAPALSLGR